MNDTSSSTTSETTTTTPGRRHVNHIFRVDRAEAARAMGVLEIKAYCGRWINIGEDPSETDMITDTGFYEDDCKNCLRVLATSGGGSVDYK